MKEKIIEIIIYVAPFVLEFVSFLCIVHKLKTKILNIFQKKIEEVNEAKEFKDMKEKLNKIHNEILEMRGKRK